MIFKQIEVGNMQNFCYIIGDKVKRIGAIVDAGWEGDKLLSIAEEKGLKIIYILITHNHFDHVNSLPDIFEKTNAEIVVHKYDKDEIENLGLPVKPVKDEDIIKLGNLKIKVIHTPGHTPGSVCYLAEETLFTGDTLFVEAVGRVDLPGGNIRDLYQSLQKIKTLNNNIKVCPGHDYGSKKISTIGYEKLNNPYMTKKEDFLKMR